jgi:hypothetical protein
MRTINTLAELKQERQRLYLHKAFLETEIKNDLNDIKEQLKPLRILTKGAVKMLSSKENGIVGNSVGYLTDLIVKNVVMRKSGFLAKLIVPYLAKNVASNIAEENKPTIVHWIEDLISRFRQKPTENAV